MPPFAIHKLPFVFSSRGSLLLALALFAQAVKPVGDPRYSSHPRVPPYRGHFKAQTSDERARFSPCLKRIFLLSHFVNVIVH